MLFYGAARLRHAKTSGRAQEFSLNGGFLSPQANHLLDDSLRHTAEACTVLKQAASQTLRGVSMVSSVTCRNGI